MSTFKPTAAFGGFSVDDLEPARAFYRDILGLKIEDEMGGMQVSLPNDATVWVYPKQDHQPATYTTLNFVVDDIDTAVDALTANGVVFEHYANAPQDEKGVMRGLEHNMGPNIAWFKDPAGNILAVLQEK